MNAGVATFAQFARHTADTDLSGLWWAGATENGWGVSITHRAASGQKFAALYIYDQQGEPTWYVMPGGVWSDNFSTFTGQLYQPRGPRLDQYNRDALVIGEAKGEMTLRVISATSIALQYRINGNSGSSGNSSGGSGIKQLQRQALSNESIIAPADLGDLWWAGMAENGWGLSIAQQANALFAVWYSYDRAGNPIWYVMPSGAWQSSAIGRSYVGTLFKTIGSTWIGATYDPLRLQITNVGSLRLGTDLSTRPATITMQYQFTSGVFMGVEQIKSLVRQPF